MEDTSRYIILKFGTRRVLLLSRDGESATMTRHVDGGHLTFDYSACDVLGSVTVADGDLEPTPDDILEASRRFQAECNEKISNAIVAGGAVLVCPPALPEAKYIGQSANGTQYTCDQSVDAEYIED